MVDYAEWVISWLVVVTATGVLPLVGCCSPLTVMLAFFAFQPFQGGTAETEVLSPQPFIRGDCRFSWTRARCGNENK
jgi:hypothetical protein